MLRFSYQSFGESRAFQRALNGIADDPLLPVQALISGENGVVVISNLPVEQFKVLADAIAAVLGVRAMALNSLETGDFN